MTNLLEVYNKWQSSLQFREAFKKNPEQALKEAGFKLSPEDLSKIKTLNFGEKLDDRISK